MIVHDWFSWLSTIKLSLTTFRNYILSICKLLTRIRFIEKDYLIDIIILFLYLLYLLKSFSTLLIAKGSEEIVSIRRSKLFLGIAARVSSWTRERLKIAVIGLKRSRYKENITFERNAMYLANENNIHFCVDIKQREEIPIFTRYI